MYSLRIATILILTALIGACSVLHKKEEPTLYQSNIKTTQPLVMPASLAKEGQEEDYPLPKLQSQPANAKVSILPPGSSLAKESKK